MFGKVIVLGVGKCALGCVKYLLQKGIQPELYCVGSNPVNLMRNQAKGLLGDDAARNLIKSGQEMTKYLFSQKERTLVISAVNFYLFPAEVLRKENIIAVNFHNAYLPLHRGLNAEAWAIFEQDEFAGVTWHFVTEQLDAGKIIVQKKIPLSDETTAFSLLSEQNRCALSLFQEHFDEIYEETVEGEQQAPIVGNPVAKLHYSWEKPNDGRLDLAWNANKISAFLRCFDYGILHTMGIPYLCYEGENYEWKKYEINRCNTNIERITKLENAFTIEKDGKRIILTGLKQKR